MSYFRKINKPAHSEHHKSVCIESQSQKQTYVDSRKTNQSRHSYLKAFKKYYIDKLLNKKKQSQQAQPLQSKKQNFCFNQQHIRSQQSKPQKHAKKFNLPEKMKLSIATDLDKNKGKIKNMVANNDSQISQALYSSIRQIQKHMDSFENVSDLAKQNKLLKETLNKLKFILKEKLQTVLSKNKQELTLMFQQYSSMIKKLLEDKEILTNQIQSYKQQLKKSQKKIILAQKQHQNKIKIIVQDNQRQISATKQQISQFLQMIVQYQGQADKEKEEMNRLREQIVDLQMENDRLKNISSSNSDQFSSNQHLSQTISRYSSKIQNHLQIIQRLQKQNQQLNEFLRACKCSKIQLKSQNPSEKSLKSQQNVSQIIRSYENKLIEAEKQYIKEEIHFREAVRKKDKCIDRLNLVIQEFRKTRYSSVDKMTAEACASKLR